MTFYPVSRDNGMKEQHMVPGMTERERRIADAQRLSWLAEARIGPAPHRQLHAVAGVGVLWRRRAMPSFVGFAQCPRRMTRKLYAPVMAR